jgi:hypothetical protein
MSSEDKMIFRCDYGSFVPANTMAKNFFEKIPTGAMVELTGKRPRNLGHHRKFFEMIRICAENTDYSVDEFVFLVKIGIGHADAIITPGGNTYYKPKSIAFHKMDQTEFDTFYRDAIQFICTRLLPGTNMQDLEDAVRDFA